MYWGLTGQAKERFDQKGISIPFPPRDVHIIRDETPATLPETEAKRTQDRSVMTPHSGDRIE